ncbi:hypothetical protein ANANG_G00024870 [Anguilla anguilla]|uniref:CAP-Gly domain-containing protein n=1 Tax=Anguilla anguilla TaxID=7936 RepID=A0A9D3SB19_ANGAN|nr:hypothetical protein ANANG_G00024870 [Anguilla anguilla]
MPLEMADAAAQAKEMRALLKDVLPQPRAPVPSRPTGVLSDKARAQLSAMGIQIGDRVVIAGQKVGILRFCGSTDFAGGQWAGVELDDPEGKNNGSVAGVQYFSCRPKHGIFAPLSKITKPSERRRNAPLRSSTPLRSARLDLSHVTSKVNTGKSTPSVQKQPRNRKGLLPPYRAPAIPWWARQARPCFSAPPASTATAARPDAKRASPAHFKGHAPNRSDPRWRQNEDAVGEQLGGRGLGGAAGGAGPGGGPADGRGALLRQDQLRPGVLAGRGAGQAQREEQRLGGGVQYFSCPPKHGVFAPPSRVQRIHGSLDCLSELTSSRLNRSFTGIRRSFSTSSAISTPREPSRRSPVSRTRPTPLRRRWSTVSGAAPGAESRRGLLGAASSGSDRAVKLHLGMQVLLTSANEMGAIRYLGTADFAPGLWLGLGAALRQGQERRRGGGAPLLQLPARPRRLVRPSRVTYRGINGGRLVDEPS